MSISPILAEESYPQNSQNAERQQIDSEIESLYARIRFLKSRRNQLAPVSQLPPELLLRIFFFTQELALLCPKSYYEWLAVSRVSTHWRDVALGTSALWGGIVQAAEEHWLHANLSVQRSGLWGLDVLFHDLNNNPKNVDFLLTLLPHTPRIRSLDIRLSAGWNRTFPGVELISDFLARPAPCLESLTLAGPSDRGVSFVGISTPLFMGVAPQLHTLRLLRAQIDWDFIPPFTNLVNLQLQDSFDTRFSLSKLILLLDYTTGLRTLSIDWSYRNVDTSRTDRLVHLPNLTSLDLRMQGDEVAFLERVRIPLHAVQSYLLNDLNSSFFEALGDCFSESPLVANQAEHIPDSEQVANPHMISFRVSSSITVTYPSSVNQDDVVALVQRFEARMGKKWGGRPSYNMRYDIHQGMNTYETKIDQWQAQDETMKDVKIDVGLLSE
ncbi:hypothetical protein BDN72DRAFT_936244 [Pluteus cervinus]|uniref:Uncharacterized protein n=1 Tax=Pluteus cervinus TaxID=181527 RepID=A0ACD3B024_9AGAR|nr:hypothetical protein BDN72DRAFT_936244 [Pluteus cervinus]